MEGLELVSFEIITTTGTARSLYIDAIYQAKKGDFEAAEKQIKEGDQFFVEGHHIHAQIIQQEANGQKSELSLLMVHALDLLMSAEAFGILAKEFIDIYKKIDEK